MTNFIWITISKIMHHAYPDAPDEVAYLKNEHRHNFKFRVSIQVHHDNRDIEFHMFKRYIEQVLNDRMTDPYDAGGSCEMIADSMYEYIKVDYPNRHVKIEVSEDGENGVLMDYPINHNV